MVRQVIPLAALGLFLVPDWATATGRRRCCPPPLVAVYGPPPVGVCPPFLPVFDACPVPIYPLPPIVSAAPIVLPGSPPKTTGPKVETDPPTAPAPKPAGRTEPDPPPFKPAVPPLGVPPDPRPGDTPKLPPAGVSPTPPAERSPLTLPPEPKTSPPVVPGLKPVNPGGSDLPDLPLPPARERTSGSSPVTARAFEVRLVPSAGAPPAAPDAKRSVAFINLSAVDVVLTVEGESAVLPPRHELTATVPATFRWRLDGGEARTGEVPAAAPGAEVVIR